MILMRECCCTRCNRVTLLPASILPDTSKHQPRLPTGEQCIAVVCPHCKHVYGYKAAELPLVRSESQNPYADPTRTSVTDVLLQCDDNNCESRVRVLVIATPILRTNNLGEQQLEFCGLSAEALTWITHDLRCGKGHPIWLPPKSVMLS